MTWGKAVLQTLLGRYLSAEGLVSREDVPIVSAMTHSIERMLEEHGVAMTPLVALRAEDVFVSWLVARRIEADLCAAGIFIAAPRSRTRASCEEPAPAMPAQNLTPAIEAAGKARERMRKAMKELEETCEKMGTPIDKGLADIMRPILKKAEGAFEEAIAMEEARKKQEATQMEREQENDWR